MNITVKGKQIDLGDALRTHVTDTLSTSVVKYFGNPLDATVVFSREAHLYKADIQVHVGRGILLQSNAEAVEPYPAFDEAVEKVAKRLRRYKRRLRDHHNGTSGGEPPLRARKYILEAPTDEAEEIENNPIDDGHPGVVIAEMETAIELLTVSEAVMRMDLAELPALMFRNRAHGGLNMVYRRRDGNVGWIDPAETQGAVA